MLEIISHCPVCGSPIYGRKQILLGDKAPKVVRTCSCASDHSVSQNVKEDYHYTDNIRDLLE